MSKERARRRAEERARKSAPRSKATATHDSESTARQQSKPAKRRSARAERQRRRLATVVACWALANITIWLVWSSWQAVWIGLTVTTIAAPVIAWLLWDPEGRVDL